MNRSETEDGRHEIIIVRRGGHDDEEGHHGGVWKIAFADFMTAMMCFFLVMWLINATNEETRVALASYFNPVKLIDYNTSRRGLDDIGEGPEASSAEEINAEAQGSPHNGQPGPTGPSEEDEGINLSEVPPHSDENLFADPYAVLSEIAANTGRLQNISAKGEGGANEAGPATGASGGESYRDPFAPDFWSTQVETPAANETTQKYIPEGEIAEVVPEEPDKLAEVVDDPFGPGKPVATKPSEQEEQELAAAFPGPASESSEPGSDAAGEEAVEAPVQPVQAAVPKPERPESAPVGGGRAEKLAETIRTELAQAFGGTANLDGITVEQSDAGVMISVADDIQEGMFEIGSAVPRRDLVLAMEKIGRTLAGHGGTVTINGHTDGRPFSSGDYDNWRLSTARAHATYYMLVRGGLDEKRITGVAGYADRRLKRPDDPFASVNRRIEILLGAPG